MALQDLTPQLRTRLSRMERAVGWFVMIALGLLIFGFVYYIYDTAERKGWFKTKAPYFTFAERATGLKVGDPVQLMGFPVGRITRIDAQPPYDPYNVYVEFEIIAPYYGYLWTRGSVAKIGAADLLGKRVLEVTKGVEGYPSYLFHPLRTNMPIAEIERLPNVAQWRLAEEVFSPDQGVLVGKPFWPLTNLPAFVALDRTTLSVMNLAESRKAMTGMWNDREGRYDPFTNHVSKYWLVGEESPAVTERLEQVISQVEQALPTIFGLTNQLHATLARSSDLVSNVNFIVTTAQPAVSDLAAITSQLKGRGALGEWLLPTNLNRQLEGALGQAEVTLHSANTTLTAANTNLASLVDNLNRSLNNLSGITSNLNRQVEANTNLVGAISQTIVHADEFVQGLKRHWLLRSAFKTKKPKPPAPPPERLLSPKQGSK